MMNKLTLATALLLSLALTACEEPDPAALVFDEEAPAAESAAAAGPVTFCGWAPVCPQTMRAVYVGCDARCYVVNGYDCTFGYNRVDCVSTPPEASITASPSTVTVTPGALGTTRICWNTKYLNYPVWIRVRVNGGPGQLFTKESDDGAACENAGWIQAGSSYAFSIHDDDADSSPVYTSVTVTGVPGQVIPPQPGVCEPGGSGVCGPGKDCHCGESFCTASNLPCP
jgi:hypothetical protein